MSDDKIKMSADSLDKLMQKVFDNFNEERDLALERYRRQDEQMVSEQDFILQGKNAVDYLKTAAERSNSMLVLAKMIKDVVYRESSKDGDGKEQGGFNDSVKQELQNMLKELNDDK